MIDWKKAAKYYRDRLRDVVSERDVLLEVTDVPLGPACSPEESERRRASAWAWAKKIGVIR